MYCSKMKSIFKTHIGYLRMKYLNDDLYRLVGEEIMMLQRSVTTSIIHTLRVGLKSTSKYKKYINIKQIIIIVNV